MGRFYLLTLFAIFAANGYCMSGDAGRNVEAGVPVVHEKELNPRDTEDIPSYVLRRFYAEYVAEWLCGAASDTKSVSERYITKRLRNRLRNLYEKHGLDYDPFLEAQDCDGHTLDSLRVERDADRPEIRRVYIWDSYNKRYKEIVLRMKLEGEEWKIDDIESLPAVYAK